MTSSDLTADLPAPRDDEPASLRSDIADELRDHLECALRREQLRAGESTSNTEPRGLSPWPDANGVSNAYQRVLQRFGNPRSVARKLWWDAMQERIMAQRITALMAGIGAAACVAACLVLWQFMQDSRTSQAAALTEMRDFNAKLLAGLQRPTEAPSQNSGWSNVRIKLIDAESGDPVSAATVTLQARDSDGSVDNSIRLVKQPVNGMVEVGSLPNGQYYLRMQCPSHDVLLDEQLLIGPGHAEEIVLRVPRIPHLAISNVALNPPEPIDDRLRFVLSINSENQELDGHSWMPQPRSTDLVIDSKGRVLGAVRFPLASTSHAGYRIPLINMADAPAIPATALSAGVIQLLQPLDLKLVESRYSGEPGTHPMPGYQLLWFNTRLSVELEKTGEGVATLRPALTDQFWKAVAHAEVLAGLKPPPEGMQLVSIPVSEQPDSELQPGRVVSIDGFWGTMGPHARGGPETVQIVESADFAGFDPDSVSQPLDQTDRLWNWKVLVTNEQAALLELAQRVPHVLLRVSPVKSNDLNQRGGAADNVRQMLQRAIDAPRPIEDATQEPTGNQT